MIEYTNSLPGITGTGRGPVSVTTSLRVLVTFTHLYPTHVEDRFQCGACTVKGIELPDTLGDVIRHTYVHPLVSCRSSDASLKHESNESVMSESIADSTLLSLLKDLPPLIKDCSPEQVLSVQRAFADLNTVAKEVKSNNDHR